MIPATSVIVNLTEHHTNANWRVAVGECPLASVAECRVASAELAFGIRHWAFCHVGLQPTARTLANWYAGNVQTATAPVRFERKTAPVCLSLGMMAWNEEASICTTLESLFQQTIFQKLCARGEQVQFVVLANGCKDRTVPVAREFLQRMQREHPWSAGFTAEVRDLPEPGRNLTWNRFVHEFSARDARCVALMDADIVFNHPDTLYNLITTIEKHPHVRAASGRQRKDIEFKERKTFWDRISLATSDMNGATVGRISGQLYCIRGSIARNLYLPRDLGATDDGFMKAIICSDFLTKEVDPTHIVTAPNAEHIFEAYVAPRDILNNQKRQMIGQTSVHVILQHLRTLSFDDRRNFAETLRRLDSRDPDWLKRLLAAHVREQKYFWRLFPGLVTFRFRRLWNLRGLRKLTHLPAACAGFVVTMIACYRAHKILRTGSTQYWPKATRQAILSIPQVGVK
jgi:glycosyltransferase involved in cell wall biosynthesis